jgi:hypothetical protein
MGFNDMKNPFFEPYHFFYNITLNQKKIERPLNQCSKEVTDFLDFKAKRILFPVLSFGFVPYFWVTLPNFGVLAKGTNPKPALLWPTLLFSTGDFFITASFGYPSSVFLMNSILC